MSRKTMKMPCIVYVFEGVFDIMETIKKYGLAADNSPEGGVFVSDEWEQEDKDFLSFDRDVLIITPFMDDFYWEVVPKAHLDDLYVDA